MEQPPKLTPEEHRERLRAAARRSKELAAQNLSIAKELHKMGIESDEQLAKAEELAARLAAGSDRIERLTTITDTDPDTSDSAGSGPVREA